MGRSSKANTRQVYRRLQINAIRTAYILKTTAFNHTASEQNPWELKTGAILTVFERPSNNRKINLLESAANRRRTAVESTRDLIMV